MTSPWQTRNLSGFIYTKVHINHKRSANKCQCRKLGCGRHTVGTAGMILVVHPANERRRYKITSSLTGWAKPRMSPVYLTRLYLVAAKYHFHMSGGQLARIAIPAHSRGIVDDPNSVYPHTTQALEEMAWMWRVYRRHLKRFHSCK